ncbi:MAG: DNA polymerase [Desulfotomaculum sp. 46_296]|nr:MAG: DNA polymerase [Desulfotomaculum sp. 46_296]HAU31913.1 DNA polymerase I [Desulfotomaculum sp.]
MNSGLFLIIDGNSLAHRAFHALPLLTTSQGIFTNAVYGFANMLLRILSDRKPQFVAVCFDKGKITFRHSDYGEYKAKRKPTAEELRPQFPLIKEFLQAMCIRVSEYDNYEADDLIGTLAVLSEKDGMNNLILTGDQDALQLVSPLTRVLLTKKGITELEEYTEEKVRERYGVLPAFFVDLKGLTGDQSDNIPGVPGIGLKTASGLLQKYGTLENILGNLAELPEKQRGKIEPFASQAVLSKQLAVLFKDVPLQEKISDYIWLGADYNKLIEFCGKYEFKSLIRSLTQTDQKPKNKKQLRDTDSLFKEAEYAKTTSDNLYPVEKPEDPEALVEKVRQAGCAALAVSGSFDGGAERAVLAFPAAGEDQEGAPEIQAAGLSLTGRGLKALKTICTDSSIELIAHDGKKLIRILKTNGIPVENLSFDTMIAAYILNPGLSGYRLRDLVMEHLKEIIPGDEDRSMLTGARATYRLAGILKDKLRLQEADELFYKLEMPLVHVLADMESAGVAVDKEQLAGLSNEMARKIEDLTREIYVLAGCEFNINSTKQLSQILFEKLQLPVIRRTKTGYSTDAGVLEELADSHPIVNKILDHRLLAKLKSTYVDGLVSLINPGTGRLHTTFHQAVTATGRLSSSDPNLQNIPIRVEEGRKIRQVFIPRQKGNLILTADYSQIELRLLAHLSNDKNLKEAFLQGEDIHTKTAAEVFSITAVEVTDQMRSRAKAVNFGIIYGISDYGLARNTNISRQEAKQYIKNYFERYSGVQDYIKRTIEEARSKGYASTIMNRRRYLPDLFSSNRTVRNFGERTAVNTPIQGSAADLIKLAMIRIHRELKKRRLQTKMILQVHDELIFDVPVEEMKEVRELVKEYMENSLVLDVPLLVDLKAGSNWYEVREI